MAVRHLAAPALALLAAATAADAARGDTTVIGYTGSIVTYTVPATGLYDIKAVGAPGGEADYYAVQPPGFVRLNGGPGASVEDVFF